MWVNIGECELPSLLSGMSLAINEHCASTGFGGSIGDFGSSCCVHLGSDLSILNGIIVFNPYHTTQYNTLEEA